MADSNIPAITAINALKHITRWSAGQVNEPGLKPLVDVVSGLDLQTQTQDRQAQLADYMPKIAQGCNAVADALGGTYQGAQLQQVIAMRVKVKCVYDWAKQTWAKQHPPGSKLSRDDQATARELDALGGHWKLVLKELQTTTGAQK